MTTTTAWAPLPNAKHIDAVLADVKARPEVWAAAWAAARPAAWAAAWAAAWRAMLEAARSAAWSAAWGAAREAIRTVAWDAWGPVVALIAWDSAADLLDLSADALRTLIVTAPEPVKYQAALLLPWAIVRETT